MTHEPASRHIFNAYFWDKAQRMVELTGVTGMKIEPHTEYFENRIDHETIEAGRGVSELGISLFLDFGSERASPFARWPWPDFGIRFPFVLNRLDCANGVIVEQAAGTMSVVQIASRPGQSPGRLDFRTAGPFVYLRPNGRIIRGNGAGAQAQ